MYRLNQSQALTLWARLSDSIEHAYWTSQSTRRLHAIRNRLAAHIVDAFILPRKE